MSDYESEDELLGSTGVSLGYQGKSLQSGTDPLVNKVGGVPVWFENTPPPKDLIVCKECSEKLDLLVQINAPINNTLYDRSLYVFSCRKARCRRKNGSIRALRGVHKNEKVEARIKKELESDSEPAEMSNIGSIVTESTNANPFASGFSLEPAPSPSKPKKKKSKAKPTSETGFYPCFELEVEEEYIEANNDDLGHKVVMDEAGEDEGPEKVLDADVLAASESLNDSVFAKFVEIVSSNPQQVLRYERPLKPLAYIKDEVYPVLHESKAEPCPVHGKRTFELQLMPHLISVLEADEMLLDGMEWGTIVVATSQTDGCPQLDNNGVGYAEEFVCVQWEKTK